MAGSGERVPLVLVVDDWADSRAVYVEFLTMFGFRVIEEADGAAAVARAKAERPDVVVMDVMLPGMDGCEATRQLRADPDLCAVRVIALSGHGDGPVKERALAAGVDVYLRKPCPPEVLLEHARALAAR